MELSDNRELSGMLKSFNDFIKKSNEVTGHSTGLFQSRNLPVTSGISFEDDSLEPSRKRKHDISSDVIQKAQTAQLKHRHASIEQAFKKAHVDLENENLKLRSEIFRLKQRIETQELNVNRLTNQAIDANEELIEIKSQKTSSQQTLEEMLLMQQKRNETISLEYEENLNEYKSKIKFLKNENMEVKSQLSSSILSLEATEARMEQIKSRNDELELKLSHHMDLVNEFHEQKVQVMEMKNRLSQAEDAESLSKALKTDMNRLRELEKQNELLKQSNISLKSKLSNHRLTEEKLLSAENTIQRLESNIGQYDIIMKENCELKMQLCDYDLIKEEVERKKSIELKVQDLHHKETKLLMDQGELMSELSSLKLKLEHAEQNARIAEANLSEKEEQFKKLEQLTKRLKRRALLLGKERDGIRGILQSYDADNTATTQTDKLMERVNAVEQINTELHAEINELHQELERAQRVELSSPIKCATHVRPSLPNAEENEKLRQTVEHLVQSLKRKSDELEEIKAVGDFHKMKGDYNPATTRILHFQSNPATLKAEEMKNRFANLESENERLREKVSKLQNNMDISSIEAISVKEVDGLKHQINESNVMNQRLKEVFSKKIKEFREACYALTGFRISCTVDNQFKLVSMYAEHETDVLLFKSSSDGTMHLMDSEFSRTLGHLINLHLKHQNSFPMFLSALTAELFEQQTMMT